ncbi:MAG: hypothetical protein ACRDPE_09340 [Solirubrobacterales bacterium]
MASKKLYEAVASNLKAIGLTPPDQALVGAVLAEVFKADNPRFDEDRFREACRPTEEVVAVDAGILAKLTADYIIVGYERTAKDPTVEPGPTVDSVLEIGREVALKYLSKEKKA